ncbi:MAG: Type 4 prepilin-like proteins leader peptide-processing enzyme [Clostridia bacterium 41_269]|nr:MAG: Type 4 prepilin-like proteins leader peptide-processing enzyme [Clostridia bacterium 41_269]
MKILLFLIFTVGLIVGSFINTYSYRIIRNKPVIWDRSRCPCCKEIIKPLDLIPVFSYILLKGKCRQCAEKIGFRYPLSEIFVGLVFSAIYLKVGLGRELLPYLFISSVLTAAVFTDLENMIIPNSLVFFGFWGGVILKLFVGTAGVEDMLLGSIAGGMPLLLIGILSRGGMGGGDIKLAAVMGLILGWKLVLVALFISFCVGGLVGVMLVFFGLKGRKDCIPFGPFLAVGGHFLHTFG